MLRAVGHAEGQCVAVDIGGGERSAHWCIFICRGGSITGPWRVVHRIDGDGDRCCVGLQLPVACPEREAVAAEEVRLRRVRVGAVVEKLHDAMQRSLATLNVRPVLSTSVALSDPLVGVSSFVLNAAFCATGASLTGL